MKLSLLITLLLTQACLTNKPVDYKQTTTLVAKTEKHHVSGINGLSKTQKEEIKMLLSDIALAIDTYKNTDDPKEIAAKCDRLNFKVDQITPSIPPGLFRNALQQGSDALTLAYLFRYEKRNGIEITPELRKKVIDTYQVGDINEDALSARIFNFAQAHFEIAARMAADEGI
jgi:hypothetical protein